MPFQHHFNTRAAHETWALVFGAGVEKNRVLDRTIDQSAIAPTIAALMGFEAHRSEKPRLGRGLRVTVIEITAPARPMRLTRAFGTLRDLIVGTLLCLSPITSILALGWIIRRMHLSIRRRNGDAGAVPGWILGERGSGWLGRLIGGLAANIRVGLSGALSLGLVSLLFTLPWLLAWWAGWDNSFNKGYEQAWAGPALFFTGIGAYLFVMLHLPMALAHQAATGTLAGAVRMARATPCGRPDRLAARPVRGHLGCLRPAPVRRARSSRLC